MQVNTLEVSVHLCSFEVLQCLSCYSAIESSPHEGLVVEHLHLRLCLDSLLLLAVVIDYWFHILKTNAVCLGRAVPERVLRRFCICPSLLALFFFYAQLLAKLSVLRAGAFGWSFYGSQIDMYS